jgi:hypothetical protein
MAQQLKATWTPVWGRPDPSHQTINDYLNSYHKRIDDLPGLSADLVAKVIAASKDSSTGPDGIPFSVYRRLSDIFAPLLLRFMLHISSTRKANRSFN